MLQVTNMDDVYTFMKQEFSHMGSEVESIAVSDSMHRILAEDVRLNQNFPPFHRSSVDGYAVRAKDVFGCSETIPSILNVVGKVEMGKPAGRTIGTDECMYVPTGGEIPQCADAMVMIEYVEDYQDGTVGITKSTVPGEHIIFIGDDGKEGEILLKKGCIIGVREIGALMAVGCSKIVVKKQMKVGVLSSGNEIVPNGNVLQMGEVYDVNGPMICAALQQIGCNAEFLGIVRDDCHQLEDILKKAVDKYDVIVMSGGTSVGVKDIATEIISKLGEILVHGIAVKPGKPTIIGKVKEKLVMGLPGHPVASFFIVKLLLIRFIQEQQGVFRSTSTVECELAQNISSNHGREEYIAVKKQGDKVIPLLGKSGLITILAKADGYIKVERNCEGFSKGSKVDVYSFEL